MLNTVNLVHRGSPDLADRLGEAPRERYTTSMDADEGQPRVIAYRFDDLMGHARQAARYRAPIHD